MLGKNCFKGKIDLDAQTIKIQSRLTTLFYEKIKTFLEANSTFAFVLLDFLKD